MAFESIDLQTQVLLIHLTELEQANHRLSTQRDRLQAELTELRSRYESLQKSESRYRQLFENALIGMQFIGANGHFIEANPAFQRSFNVNYERLQQTYNVFSDPQLVENGTLTYMQRAFTGESVVELPTYFDARQVDETGEFTYGQSHYAPIRDAQGKVTEIAEITVDTTALFEAQQALIQERDRAAQERARLLSTVAQVANLLLRSPDYTAVLPDVVRLLGEAVGSDRCCLVKAKPDPESGKTEFDVTAEWSNAVTLDWREATPILYWEDFGDDWIKLAHGEVLNYLTDTREEPAKSLLKAQGITSVLYVPITTVEGLWGEIGFDNCGEPRLYDEAEIAILQIAADSIAAAIKRQAKDEELRESERRYRTLFELSSEGIYRVEFNQPIPLSLSVDEQVEWQYRYFCVVEANLAYAEMYGFDRPENAIGLRLTNIHVEDSEKNLAFMRSLVENDCQIRNYETEEIDRYGNRRYFLNNIVSDIRDGYVYGNWGTQIEITELRLAQQALLEAEQERSQELERYNIELQQTLTRLEERDRILQATANISNLLLTAENLDKTVNTALQILGEELNTDRVIVLKIEPDDRASNLSLIVWHGLYEWYSSYAISQLSHPDRSQGTFEGIESLLEQILQGNYISYLLEDLPEPFRSEQAALGVKALYAIPIFVDGQLWGTVGIDDCREVAYRSDAELSALKTTAACIGSAIQSDRTQKALLQAEQERLQELERLNAELQQTLDCLSESEERFRTLFELSSEGFYYAEVDLPCPISLPIKEQCEWLYRNIHVVEANSAFAAMYGVANPDELIGLKNADVHIPNSEKNTDFIRGTIENGYRFRNLETEEIDRHGNLRHFLNNAIIIIKDGYAIGGWGSQLDITELRLAQQALLKAEQDRVAELAKTNQALKNSLDRLAADPDLNSFLGYVLLEITQQLSLDFAALWLYDPATQTLPIELKVEQGQIKLKHQIQDPEPYLCPSTESTPVWNILLQTKQPFVVNRENAQEYCFQDTYDHQANQLNLQVAVNLLLTLGDEPIGLLGLASTQRDSFTPEELELAQALAQQATLAIQLTRLAEEAKQAAIAREQEKAAQERAAELAKANEALKRSVAYLTSTDSLQSFLIAVLQEAIQACGAVSSSVFVYDQTTQNLQNIALVIHGEVIEIATDPRAAIWRSPVPANLTNAWQTMSQERRIFWFDNDNPGDEHWSISIPWHHQFGHKNVATIPLLIGEEALGFLGLCFSTHQMLSESKLEQCWALAQHAALALRMSQLAEAAKQAAIAREQEKAAQERAAELAKTNQALKNSLDRLADNPDLDAFLGHVLLEIFQQLQINLGYLWFYDPSDRTLQLHMLVTPERAKLRHELEDKNPFSQVFSIEDLPIWDTLLQTRKPFLITRDNAALYVFRETLEWQEQNQEHQAGINLLLTLKDEPIGLLALASTKRSFTPEELELAQALAQQATLAIQLTRLANEARQLAVFQERTHIAREVHDTLAQDFAGVLMQLQAFSALQPLDGDRAQIHFARAQTLCKKGLVEARRSVWCLQQDSDRYSELLGLVQQLVEQLNTGLPLQIQVETQGTPYAVNPEAGRHLLRIIQESLVNALRHANAHSIQVQLCYLPQQLEIRVRDDGCGFDPQAVTHCGFGLNGMQQRSQIIGARLTICTQPGSGTEIAIDIPNFPVLREQ